MCSSYCLFFFCSQPKSRLESQSTLIQISPGSFSPPTDVTLKLSDGSIDAHKMILAAVSPVFERMFYGDFKEGNAKQVELPKDNYKVTKLFIDFVYNGTFNLDCLSDLFPLMEVADRYQINKVPLMQLCGECILSELHSGNYSALLLNFASLMTEEDYKKAAEDVVYYTDSKLMDDFKLTKLLPEEVVLPLYQCSSIDCPESELFYFAVDWHEYQKNKLRKSLKLVPEIFQCIRYTLIIPQILSSKVARCDLVDECLLAQAFCYFYSSCLPLGRYNALTDGLLIDQGSRKKIHSSRADWFGNDGVSVTFHRMKECTVSFTAKKLPPSSKYVLKSCPLENGIYSFQYRKANFRNQVLSINITDDSDESDDHLYTYPLNSDSLISVLVEGRHLFLKLIIDRKVQSTTTITAANANSFRFCINHLSSDSKCAFYIENYSY